MLVLSIDAQAGLKLLVEAVKNGTKFSQWSWHGEAFNRLGV
jgi:hypothetical protein